MELEDESLDCRDRHLVAVPARISSTVQSIRLEDNNIKVIGNRIGFELENIENWPVFSKIRFQTADSGWTYNKKVKSSDNTTPQLQMKSIVWPHAGDSGSSSLTETEYKNHDLSMISPF